LNSSVAALHFQVEWIWTNDFPGRPVPLVILEGGLPGFVVNQWIYDQLETGVTPSLLEEQLRAVMQLFEFYKRKYGERPISSNIAERLLADFLTAKKKGTILPDGTDPLGLYWKPLLNRKTLTRYLVAINKFDKWQSTYHGAIRMNPHERHFMNSWERCSDFCRREKWDPMLHLFSAKEHLRTVGRHVIREEHARFRIGASTLPKAFPLDRFIDLVETSKSPRDQMLFLLCAGASLRQSEPLHLFYQDVIGIDNFAQPRIRLADPERGEISWEQDGVTHKGTRKEYLEAAYKNEDFRYTVPRLYNLQPRTLGRRGRDHVGFKGMTFGDDPQGAITADGRELRFHEAFWIDPRMGYRFWLAYEQYVESVFYGRPKGWPYHPWLFVNLDKDNYGMPMTLAAVRKVWNRALHRLGIQDCGLGEHSLRHLYGYYSASVLHLPIEITQLLMHHASVQSTQRYYHIHSDEVRKIILTAVAKHHGLEIGDYLIMPGTPKPNYPASWNPPIQKLVM
jgi:hypothetical protein